MKKNPLLELEAFGQSIWMDFIRRGKWLTRMGVWEVITGFRLAPGGAQEFYGVIPDVSTYGKIVGGGLPVGAVGGTKGSRCVVK